jgi:ABC-type polysaccharide/polyol phosphate transport system ATPase subunit
MTNPVIELKDIWISYPDDREGLKKILKKKTEPFWALKGINFQVNEGEVLGIVGRNGSGKSTLLRMLTGIMEPDRGELKLNGKPPTLLSLGAGFLPNLSGIDNIFLNGLLLGYSRKEIEDRLEKIIEFSELGDFVYKPVRTYSSGMKSRLGFSIAITLDPEILLIDEVLGVGDTAFQEKSKNAILQKIKEKRTVIIVTHSTSLVKSICDRVVWLHLGELVEVGKTSEVINKYIKFMLEEKNK